MMFILIKQVFIALLSFSGSLAGMVNASNFMTSLSWNYQPYMTRSTLINSHPDEYNLFLHHYPFMVNVDRWSGSCNNLDDPAGRICVPNKTKGVNLSVFNMITRINETKKLTKDISCECKCKFNDRKCNPNQEWNNNNCRCECKSPRKNRLCGKDCIWNPGICTCENNKYLGNIIGDLKVLCDEVIEVTKSVTTKNIKKAAPIKTVPKNFNKKGKL